MREPQTNLHTNGYQWFGFNGAHFKSKEITLLKLQKIKRQKLPFKRAESFKRQSWRKPYLDEEEEEEEEGRQISKDERKMKKINKSTK